MELYSKPSIYVDIYENAVIKQSELDSTEKCDIVSNGTTRPFCRICDVFNNEEDAEKHKKLLILKADDLISTYAKEMVEYIQEIFKKVGFGDKPKQFIANAYHQIKRSNSLTWLSLNCHKLILTNGCALNLESVTDTDLLFNIISDIKNRHYFVLSEDYDLHKKFDSLSIFELCAAVQEFSLKLKGYFV